jgi:hypothetical protein
LASSPPRKRSPNDEVAVPAKAANPLLLPKALKPPLLGSEVGTAAVGNLGGVFEVLPSVDVDPKVGLELPIPVGLPKAGVVDPAFGSVLAGVGELEKTDKGLVPTAFGGL